MLKAEADDSWDDDKDAEYENVYRHRHVSSTEFQEMNLKLPLIGLLVYCISLIAFTVDFFFRGDRLEISFCASLDFA